MTTAPEPPAKAGRFPCPACPEWPPTNSPNFWGDHVREVHDGISPRTGHKIEKKPRGYSRAPVPVHPAVRLSESYEEVIDSLSGLRMDIDITMTTLRRVRRYVFFTKKEELADRQRT